MFSASVPTVGAREVVGANPWCSGRRCQVTLDFSTAWHRPPTTPSFSWCAQMPSSCRRSRSSLRRPRSVWILFGLGFKSCQFPMHVMQAFGTAVIFSSMDEFRSMCFELMLLWFCFLFRFKTWWRSDTWPLLQTRLVSVLLCSL